MTTAPHISFIVPLYNQLSATQAMLASLQATIPAGLPHEILLIDDASTDGTRAWLAGLRDPTLQTLQNTKNLGYAATNNRAAAQARGTILALLNNDLLLRPGWLEPMLDALENPWQPVGLVGNLHDRAADGSLDHAGIELTPCGQFQHRQSLPASPRPAIPMLAVTGACVLIRKSDFDRLGGFDEHYRNGAEDIDLCLALRQSRRAIHLASTSRIDHHVSLSRGTRTRQDLHNSRRLFAKWRPDIKRELAAVWLELLRTGPTAYREHLAAPLDPALLATPHLAARRIAEAVLRRQESHWRQVLDGIEPEPARAIRSQRLIPPPRLAD